MVRQCLSGFYYEPLTQACVEIQKEPTAIRIAAVVTVLVLALLAIADG